MCRPQLVYSNSNDHVADNMLHVRTMLTAMYSAELAQLSASPVVVATALWSGGAGSKIPDAYNSL
jgi:hypothetical protein